MWYLTPNMPAKISKGYIHDLEPSFQIHSWLNHSCLIHPPMSWTSHEHLTRSILSIISTCDQTYCLCTCDIYSESSAELSIMWEEYKIMCLYLWTTSINMWFKWLLSRFAVSVTALGRSICIIPLALLAQGTQGVHLVHIPFAHPLFCCKLCPILGAASYFHICHFNYLPSVSRGKQPITYEIHYVMMHRSCVWFQGRYVGTNVKSPWY